MRRTLSYALCIFALGVLTGAVIVHGQAPDWDPARALVPGVRCLDAVQELGEVWLTDELPVEFHLVNDSPDATFEVGPIRGSCTCTDVEPDRVTLGPGARATIKAVVDLEDAKLAEGEAPRFVEALTALVRTHYGEVYLLRLRATGTVRPSYAVTPGRLSFGPVTVEDPVTVELRISSLFDAEATGVEILSVPDGLQADVAPTRAGGRQFIVRVTAGMGGGHLGMFEGRVRFRVLAAAGEGPTASVEVRGRLVPDLQALPSSVLLGAVPVGASRLAEVTIRSRGGHPFVVASVEAEDPRVTVRSQGLTERGDARYEISVRSREPGPMACTAIFSVRSGSGDSSEVRLPVSAYFSPAAPG